MLDREKLSFQVYLTTKLSRSSSTMCKTCIPRHQQLATYISTVLLYHIIYKRPRIRYSFQKILLAVSSFKLTIGSDRFLRYYNNAYIASYRHYQVVKIVYVQLRKLYSILHANHLRITRVTVCITLYC